MARLRTPVTFKELCLDTASDDGVLGRFYAAATGCEFARSGDGDPGDVIGPQEGMGIAMCLVPETKTVKHRVHLDLHVLTVDDLVDLGAEVVEQMLQWTVLHDPEGGEVCAFPRPADQLPDYRVYELVVDSVVPEAIAGWWAEALGVEARHDEDHPWWWVAGIPGMPFESIVFTPVPEPKTVKNRLHWDLYGDPADFLERGATLLWEQPGRTRPIAWTVLADPEGNEFCVFEPA